MPQINKNIVKFKPVNYVVFKGKEVKSDSDVINAVLGFQHKLRITSNTI